MASRHLSIEKALLYPSRSRPRAPIPGGPRIVLNFLAKGRTGVARHGVVPKRKVVTIVDPLGDIDVPGNKAVINHILARCEPRRVRHYRRSKRVEEFLVQWEQETCTLGEALEQHQMGFDITPIINLDDKIHSQDLQLFVSAKRLTREQERARTWPPLAANCTVLFAPSPKG